MCEQTINKISVRNLVEFVLMSGDLIGSFSGSSRTADAIKAHQIIQKSNTEDYTAEVTLSHSVVSKNTRLEISGRADGIIKREDLIVVDEIKTTTLLLEHINVENPLHWGQAKCYAYIYASENQLEKIGVQLTYYQLDTKEIKKVAKDFSFDELQAFFSELVGQYLEWAEKIEDWNVLRNRSISQLSFPFANYREGQRKLVVSVYKCIKGENKLFAQAPTGIGKTMAVLFPAIKALGEGQVAKIFYLTAKTITRTVAENSLEKLRGSGLRLKALTITAKDKVCLVPEASCHPDECEYARGYYDRIKGAVGEIYQEDDFTRQRIEEISKKYCVCPFEFSLDLAYWSDIIICDYNYVFDPRVYLKRFFLDGKQDFAFLIDEAHNLVDRAREMYSADLSKGEILNLARNVRKESKDLGKALQKINSFLAKTRKLCNENGQGYLVEINPPKELYPLLRGFIKVAEAYLAKKEPSAYREGLLDIYFKVLAFLRTSENYDEHYFTYYEDDGKEFRVKLFCVDPSTLLAEGMQRGKATIHFSATLSPFEYFMPILGGDEESYHLSLTSPFPRENLCLLIDDRTHTNYKQRQNSYEKITQSIAAMVEGKKGNYLVYFPSYQYMNDVFARYCHLAQDVKVICQTPGMTEEAREDFLREFSAERDKPLVGLAVIGGVFGEGIDLTGERLSGAAIVGVGLPQVCLEREIIREYFEKKQGQGFDYAYAFPGMNKVLQAVGRVIRTDTDRGIVLLIDSRFSRYPYSDIRPVEWQPVEYVRDIQTLEQKIKRFWLN